jgi:hypothetical protein
VQRFLEAPDAAENLRRKPDLFVEEPDEASVAQADSLDHVPDHSPLWYASELL